MARDLDSSLLRAFVTVVEAGSISAAADSLARTQAAVSMQLRRLEDQLERRLLERSPRGVRLTDAGQVFLPYAQGILGAGADAQRALSAGHVAGQVRLGMLEDIAVGRLPHALRRFSAAYPRIALELVIAGSAALSGRLAAGELDLVIGDPGLIDATPYAAWTQTLHWVGARGFERDADAPLPLVSFGEDCLWQEKVLAALKRARISWRIVCTSTSLPGVQSAVEAGLGVSVLLDANIRHGSMRVLGAGEGLPTPPLADFGLFEREVSSANAAAVRSLQGFLSEELKVAPSAKRSRKRR